MSSRQRPPLFPTWADGVLRLLGSLVIVVAVVGTPGLLMAWVRSPLHTGVGQVVEQPVQFDHRHHTRDDGIDCHYCHYDSVRSPSAGMPDTATCMGCHVQVWKDSPLLAPVRRSLQANVPLQWNRVHDLPDFVYFDHAIHIQRGVGCESCHGRVDLMASVYKVESLHMGWCLDCHRRPEQYLRSPDRITEMGYVPEQPQVVVGERIRTQLNIQPPTDCSSCHR